MRNTMKSSKKAQVGGLQVFIMGIVTVAIVLAIGLIVLGEMTDTAREMQTTSASNESVTLTTNAGRVSQGGELFISASSCRNATSSVLTLNLYCNVSSTGAVVVSPANHSGTVYIDYSHYTPSAAYNSTKTIVTKMATVPTWLSIIIIVALAFIVLSYFMGKRQ